MSFLEELAEKYLNNTCTKEEARKVLLWFQTAEGEAFLQKKLDDDIRELDDDAALSIHKSTPAEAKKLQINSAHLNTTQQKSYYDRSFFLKVAASILLLTLCVGFYWLYQHGMITGEKAPQQQVYTTGPKEQKKITLADGTHIRMNENSKLWLIKNHSDKYRVVKLKGEALFKVTHNPQHPFMVVTNGARIKDIGTVFDVKSVSGKKNVQVAVVEGEVLFKSQKGSQKQAVKLTEGHFGYLNTKNHQITVNQFAVKNYLSWMSNRMVFEDASLAKVSRQLSHLYNINCSFANNDLKSMKITTDFKADSLHKVLYVIAQTLHIRYKKDGNKIEWMNK